MNLSPDPGKDGARATNRVRSEFQRHCAVAFFLIAGILGAGMATLSAAPSSANDNFADSITLSGSSGATSGGNVGATKEAGEPHHGGDPGGKSIWWEWTAPWSGTASIDTFGSGFDTLLGVYTGTSVSSLTTIASNDDTGDGLQSQGTFSAIAGTSYKIAVDGYQGASGSIILNWSLAPTLPPVTVVATDATAGEPGTSQGTGMFTFSRMGSTASALTVTYTVGGTASSGTDYGALGTSVSFVAGSATATKAVSVIDDALAEDDETMLVTLTGGSDYSVGSPSSATVRIKDDDVHPNIRISPLTLTFDEPSDAAAEEDGAAEAEAAASQRPPETAPEQPGAPEEKLLEPNRIMQALIEGQTARVVVNLNRPVGARAAVNFKSAASLKPWQAAIRAHQDRIIAGVQPDTLRSLRFQYENISAFSAEVTSDGLQALMADPRVASIEPVFILEAHLNQGIPLMNALASRSTYDGSGMAIAICDTGVDYNHPRLGGGGFPNTKVLGGYDFGDLDSDPSPNGQAHGTACAGIAAGDLGTAGDYIGGVAPGAKIYALKISYGSGGFATTDAMIAAWDWCVSHQNDDPINPIMVISTSFGGDRFFTNCDWASPGMTLAANNAVAAGITVLVSSGNGGYCDSMAWPACLSSVISVGAVYDAGFGIYNPCLSAESCAALIPGGCDSGFYAADTTAPDVVTSYSNMATFLGLLAPANQCYTLDISGSPGYSSGDYILGFGGTSAACPYAAGAVAALQSAAKARTGSYLTPAEVKTRLESNGDLITDSKVAITKARVNLGNAIATLPTGGQTFRIYNDGTGALTVNSIVPQTSAPWLSVAPAGPFDVAPGGYQDVTLNVNFLAAPGCESTVRLLVDSTDPDKNPYPGGVNVMVRLDGCVTVAATDSAAAEPGDPGMFTFTRSMATNALLVVNFAVSGTATSGADYNSIGTSVTIPSGSSSISIAVTPLADALSEGDETVIVTLAASADYSIGSPGSATLTIADGQTPTDTDNDGIPDSWESSFGLNPNDPNDAAGDADGDGQSNLQEYIAGTDPLDPGSRFRLTFIEDSNGDIQVSFTTSPLKSYSLERNDNFPADSWVLVNSLIGSGSPMQIIDPGAAASSKKCYRVRCTD